MKNVVDALAKALASAGIDDAIESVADLSGGCIHRVVRATLSNGRSVVAKANRSTSVGLFLEECAGLIALRDTKTVAVPQPLTAGTFAGQAILLMEFIRSVRADDNAWTQFGHDLAALHAFEVGHRYGFEIDNHLGTMPQPNAWCEDWVEFNAEYRLGHQLRHAQSRGLVSVDESDRIHRVVESLEAFIPRRPNPSLLHGDLWSGNALAGTTDDEHARIHVIDPAPYVGDGWADIAMMQLFGGFPQSCFNAYTAAVDDHERVESRIAVYQLYHVLNHVNLFGRGYVAQAMALADRLA